MNLSFKIARRYLFSRKSHNAINVISLVSVCGVAVTTMALICTLSVYNGFQDLISQLYSSFDPQIKITLQKGKAFESTSDTINLIRNWPEIDVFTEVLEENALISYKDRQVPALIKGVSDNFNKLTSIDSILIDGHFILKDNVVNYATIGVGLASQIGIGAKFVEPIRVFAPKRTEKINLNNPTSAFEEGKLFLAGIFNVNQQEYDDRMMIVPLDFARQLFQYNNQVTGIELKLKPGVNENQVQKRLTTLLGDKYSVKNRLEQQEASYRMMQIEKWMTFLILSFILMIATFNVIGSLSMLIIDKQDDVLTLRNLGADDKLISSIFLLEGWLISALGAVIGVVFGVLLCWIQEHFGILRLGNTEGAFIIDAYPVKMKLTDTLIVITLVGSLGIFAAFYPVRYFRKRLS